MSYGGEGCRATHKQVDDRLNKHDETLDKHGERLDKLEQNEKANAVRLDNLCKQLASLVSIMKWFLLAIGGGIITLIFTAIEKGFLK